VNKKQVDVLPYNGTLYKKMYEPSRPEKTWVSIKSTFPRERSQSENAPWFLVHDIWKRQHCRESI
jgi:hypothetical protein